MKYHNFIVILLILTRFLSYQDGIIVQSLFLPIFAKVVGWFWICSVLVQVWPILGIVTVLAWWRLEFGLTFGQTNDR